MSGGAGKVVKPVILTVFFCLMTGFVGRITSYADNNPVYTFYPSRLAVGQVGLFSIHNLPATRVRGTFLGRPVFFRHQNERFFSLLPVDLDVSPGIYPLTIEYRTIHHGTLKTLTLNIEVHPYKFSVEKISLPEKMVTFPGDVLKRIQEEKKTVYAVFKRISELPLWEGNFIKPVNGDIVGLFGSRRILNGKERSPHSGVDIRAQKGTPVLCPNNGRVALVGDFYLMGKTVIVDHGEGVFTFYCHLSNIKVKEGDLVAKREPLGEVGASGRATGPHLHWGIRICGARVDPLSFLKATAPLIALKD